MGEARTTLAAMGMVERIAAQRDTAEAERDAARAQVEEMREAILGIELSAYPAHGSGFVVQATGKIDEFQRVRAALHSTPSDTGGGK
jgi:hypothetical protein